MSRIFNRGNVELNSFIHELLDLQEDDRVLEIGFGPGALLNQIAQVTTKGLVEGIDISDAMITQATKANKDFIDTKRIQIHKGNCNDLPYSTERFDKVCTANTLYFWEDPTKIFVEIFRTLKSDGKLVVGFRDKTQIHNLPLSREVFNAYTRDEVKRLLLNAGFASVRMKEKEGQRLVSYCAVATKT